MTGNPARKLGACLAVMISASGCFEPESKTESPAAVAKVTEVTGDVKARRSEALAWGEVERGMGLFHRDSVKTNAASRGVLLFQDQTVLNVGENTLVVVVEKVSDRSAKAAPRQNVISMPKGTIDGRPGPNELLVKTPRGWIRASGKTAFRAKLAQTGKMEVVATGEPVHFVTAEGETKIEGSQKLSIPESKEWMARADTDESLEGDVLAELPPALPDVPRAALAPVATEERIVIADPTEAAPAPTPIAPPLPVAAPSPVITVAPPTPVAIPAPAPQPKKTEPASVFKILEPKPGKKTKDQAVHVRGQLGGRYRV
ncbi:MAG: FecR domain-containing protein, partial [Bdellovibrionota bacterium]